MFMLVPLFDRDNDTICVGGGSSEGLPIHL